MLENEFFKNKVIFITGSSRGIGKAAALLFGRHGARVCINGRNIEYLEETRRELEADSVTCLSVPGDVSDSEQCRAMIDAVIAAFGRLDVLINNAGITSHGRFGDQAIDVWKQSVGINLMGAVYMSTYALPHLIESKGSIVFVSTLAGKLGLPGHSTYSASKMGLSALAQSMQVELEGKGVHTGIIYVGFTENEGRKQVLYPDGMYRKIADRNRREAKREDVAGEILRMVQKRKKRVTLSMVGKLQAAAIRFFPFIIGMVLRKADRDYDTMYDSPDS